VAERTGLITVVGTHLLRTACRQVAAFDPPDGTLLPVSINVTPRQLLDPDFSTVVRRALADTGLAPPRLVVEIVEADELDDPTVKSRLDELTGTGVRLALDDFGVGDASLTRLRSLPVRQIKIHPKLLAPVADRVGADVLESIRAVAEIFGLEVVATGVDTAAQAQRLRAMTLTHAQGLHVAAPMPAHDLADWLARTAGQTTAASEARPTAGSTHP
jgi:diguanylate cyclase